MREEVKRHNHGILRNAEVPFCVIKPLENFVIYEQTEYISSNLRCLWDL